MNEHIDPNAKPENNTLTIEDLDEDLRGRIHEIRKEFIAGLNMARKHRRSVTFFGSARYIESNPYYEKARIVARRVAEAGIAVVTGGGSGIMEAANRGASEAEGEDTGHSIGLNIELPEEQALNEYAVENREFHYFFARKVALTFGAEAYVVFPGGFGTLDECFEVITLMQTDKMKPAPVILVGSAFWEKVEKLLQETLYETFSTISAEDQDLYEITDDPERILEIIEKAPQRNE